MCSLIISHVSTDGPTSPARLRAKAGIAVAITIATIRVVTVKTKKDALHIALPPFLGDPQSGSLLLVRIYSYTERLFFISHLLSYAGSFVGLTRRTIRGGCALGGAQIRKKLGKVLRGEVPSPSPPGCWAHARGPIVKPTIETIISVTVNTKSLCLIIASSFPRRHKGGPELLCAPALLAFVGLVLRLSLVVASRLL
jgi:hypothetical protein